MSQFQTIHISGGKWITYWEDSKLPGSFIRFTYTIVPGPGFGMPRDGTHKGFVTQEGKLRLITGGEYYQGTVINHNIIDYDFVEDKADNEEYEKGYRRRFEGKRKATFNYFCKQSQQWREGYQTANYHIDQHASGQIGS
jgi:hypothetical protein